MNASNWMAAKAPQNYSGLYTRMQLGPTEGNTENVGTTAENLPQPKRDYAAENRGRFARFFASKTNTVTATANIALADPIMSIAIPLSSVTHASGRSLGNVWTTNYTASSIESPLFIIGPNTGLTIHLSAKISSDRKSQGTSLAIGAISDAVRIAAPASSLLTSLSASDVNNKATAIDSAISNLLSADISEDIEIGRLADSWTPGSWISLYGCAPFISVEARSVTSAGSGMDNCANAKDLGGSIDTVVGQWALTFACPRPSAFDPRDICSDIGTIRKPHSADGTTTAKTIDISTPDNRKALWTVLAAAISDAQVLQFNMSSQVTVAPFVKSQSWLTTFTASQRTANDYARFCSGGIVALEASGLNQFDAALILRAAIDQFPELENNGAAFPATGAGMPCVRALSAVGVSIPQ